jgi:ribonuclease G
MGKELVVSSDLHETKVAILEDGQLVEIYFQRSNEYSLAGSIHKGRVTRVLPGMQSAFVDLGLERDTFLYVSDFLEDQGEEFEQIDERQPRPAIRREALVEKPLIVAPVILPAVPAAEAPASPQDAASREDRDGRRFGRGGRRRRGRGNGSRFPDSKFASAAEPVTAPEVESISDSGEDPVEEAEPILLPGETLRKYQRPAVPRAPQGVPVAEPTGEQETQDREPEPPRLYTHVPEPDAPIHHPMLEEGELPVEAAVEIEASEVIEGEAEDEEPEQQDAASLAVEELTEEDENGDDVMVVDAEEEDSSEDEDETPGEDDSEENGSDEEQPQDETPALSAEVREPSGNRLLQQRSGRRGRRRGRGRGDRPERTDAPLPSAEAKVEAKVEERRPERVPLITDLLKEGQEILVQIAKEPLGQKGARITSHIALPGRYCVYMPTVEHTGVSRKIASDEERQRLKRILMTHKQGMSGGFIISSTFTTSGWTSGERPRNRKRRRLSITTSIWWNASCGTS